MDIVTVKYSNCEIYKTLQPGKVIKSTVIEEAFKMNFHFDCSNICVVYLLTCRICQKQYTCSTITRFREQFNQYQPKFKFVR